MDADEPNFISAIRHAMRHREFVFPGDDQYKRMETVACLWTMPRKLRQRGTFVSGENVAKSDDLEDNPLALVVNQPDDGHNGARAVDMDQADRSISLWLRCDANNKLIVRLDHGLLQHSSFQTADTTDKHNVKAFGLGSFKSPTEPEFVPFQMNELGIRRGLL